MKALEKTITLIVLLGGAALLYHSSVALKFAEQKGSIASFRVGWISALTGPVSKYAAHESAILAVEDINREGGVLGRPLELIMEDGRCHGPTTVTAAKKLIEIDKVDFILGGHCSTETVTLAPLAERHGVVVVASITSSPAVTHAGKYIFRTSSIATGQSVLLAKHLRKTRQAGKLAILYEDTAYVGPIAEALASKFREHGGKVVTMELFRPGETEFRSLLLKVKASKPDALFMGVQAQDTGLILMRQIRELGIRLPVFGNEVLGNAVTVYSERKELFEGIIFGESEFDVNAPRTSAFIERYTRRFKRNSLPYGFWNADAYDGVRILAKAINDCGPDKEKVRECLNRLENYPGVSGSITFDDFGDAQRKFVLKGVFQGEITVIR